MKRRSWLSLGLALSLACDGEDAPPLEIVTASLPDVALNAGYAEKIEATGGTAPYAFAIESGTLPEGIELERQTGQLMGIAAQPGRASFAVAVSDSDGQTASKDLSIYVVPEPLAIVTTVLPSAKEGESYDQALVGRGGVPPYRWTLDAGDLPAGIQVVEAGRLSGTPAASGGFDFQVKVADAEETERLQMLHLFVLSRNPEVTTSTIPKARQGEPYSVTLVARGGVPPYSWEHVAGALPQGISLANDGSLTGVPDESGEFQLTVRVADSAQREGMVSLLLRVLAPLQITTPSLPQILVGRTIDTMLAASGGEPPYLWSLEGTLPDGVTFEDSGRLSGGSTSVGVYPLTIRVEDADGFRDSGLFDLRVTDRYTFEVTPMLAFPPSCGTGVTTSSVVVELPVAESFAIDDVDVGVKLTYRNNGGGAVANDDLKITLFSPSFEAQTPLCGDGAEIPGGLTCLGSGGIDRTFDSEGAPVDRPQRPLGAFKGLNARGTWTLRVAVATPACTRMGVIERVVLSIRDDRSPDDYVIVRGFTRNNLLLAPWVRITTGNDGGLDQHDIFLSATIYSVGPNGIREAGAGDDVPQPVPLTWQWGGSPISGTTLTADGHVRAGSLTGDSTVVASGGGYVITVPLHVVPPDWNPLVRIP